MWVKLCPASSLLRWWAQMESVHVFSHPSLLLLLLLCLLYSASTPLAACFLRGSHHILLPPSRRVQRQLQTSKLASHKQTNGTLHCFQCQVFHIFKVWSMTIILDSASVTQCWMCCCSSLSNSWKPQISNKKAGPFPWTHIGHLTEFGNLCLSSSACGIQGHLDSWVSDFLHLCCSQVNLLLSQWSLEDTKVVCCIQSCSAICYAMLWRTLCSFLLTTLSYHSPSHWQTDSSSSILCESKNDKMLMWQMVHVFQWTNGKSESHLVTPEGLSNKPTYPFQWLANERGWVFWTYHQSWPLLGYPQSKSGLQSQPHTGDI